ncbi:hypothetical protein [Bacteriovorax sp. BSW11_IV]|uniref:hypothetical protein n=1 Tax=Bacteriovorax sp. BSW11_IV TaxID=1353529 RepID=UPI0012DC6222|nr:hypothetical protein [Bacteriovorax sp. BSW11_IV]
MDEYKSKIMESKCVFFIRHSNFKNYSSLINENVIGIHYNGDKEVRFIDLDSRWNKPYVRTSINYFKHLSEHGGIVFAKYKVLSANGESIQKVVIGLVEKNTPIEEQYFNFDEDGKVERDYVKYLKYIPLIDNFSYAEAPVLAIFGGRSTLAKYSTKDIFYQIVKETILLGNRVQGTKDLIHPKCLEQLCVEWLRRFGTARLGSDLDYCYIGVGSSYPDIDIAGRMIDNRKLFAQVTFSSVTDISWKVDTLLTYKSSSSNNLLVMFCCINNDENIPNSDVIYLNIVDVINDFILNDRENILNDFVGIQNVKWNLIK